MNIRVVHLIALAATVAVWSSSPTTTMAGDQQGSLRQVVSHALRNNPELRSFREEKGIRDAARLKAEMLPNPNLEFEGATGALTGSSAENSLSLGVSQEFLLAGKRGKRIAVAGHDLESYRWQLAERERLLRDDVSAAFYTAILAAERVALAERSISLNRQLLDVARERLAAGDIPELEMNLVKVELARSEGSRITLLRELSQSQWRLKMLLGSPAAGHPGISGNFSAGQPLTRTLDELKRQARSERPDIKVLESEKAKGEAEIDLARAERVPNLTAGLAFRRDTTAMEIGGVEGKDTANTIGLRLSIPIPLFDRNQYGVQDTRARKNSAESRLSALVATVDLEVEAAFAGVKNADSILLLYRDTILNQLEENLKLTQEAYRLGEVGILVLIQEQKKFIEVNESYLTALHDRQLALVKLETAVGSELHGGAQ